MGNLSYPSQPAPAASRRTKRELLGYAQRLGIPAGVLEHPQLLGRTKASNEGLVATEHLVRQVRDALTNEEKPDGLWAQYLP